jgi:hypothetical protein
MLYIAHRINTIDELISVPIDWGVEIDIRDYGEELILQHDPYIKNTDNIKFEDWLRHYKHSLIILNIKSEGIEYKVLDLLKKYNIKEYFFLDCSIPMINKLINKGERNIAIRYSEYEPKELYEKFRGKCKWIWLDCFTHYPCIDEDINSYYKICIVGPSLQGHLWDIKEDWKKYDAVCDKTYNYKKWLNNI